MAAGTSVERGAGGSGANRRTLAVIVGSALVLAAAARYADGRERELLLRVDCHGANCEASIDEGPTLSVEAPASARATRLGLYVYHPRDNDSVQRFRDLTIIPRSRFASEVRLALTSPADLLPFERDAGWTIRPERGLAHEMRPGARAVALLGHGYRDFTLQLKLIDSIDAGLLLHAEDRQNGLLLVVRATFNDVFFCRLTDGLPGPMLGIVPLAELRPARELLRLGGRAAEILLLSLALLAVLRRVAALPGPELLQRSWRTPQPPRWLAPALFAATAGAAVWIALAGYGGVPHIDDEGAYLFQAKIFARGGLWAPPPPPGGFFEYQHLITTGERWFGKYPPLFPLLLAVGVLAGAPWLVDPILCGLTGLVIYRIAREVADWRVGMVAWLLALSSPFFMLLGGSMMAHTTSALLVSVALLLALRGIRSASRGATALAGLVLGLAALARPYSALLAAIAAGLFLVGHAATGGRRREVVALGLILVACSLPFGLAYVGWNLLLSGPDAPSLDLYASYDGTDSLGFGPDKGLGWRMTWGSWGHTPAKALRNVTRYVESLSTQLLGWPERLSLALLLAGLWACRRESWIVLPVALAALLVLGHMIYWGILHIGFGARYWFEAAPWAFVLSALGLRAVVRSGRPASPATARARGGGAWVAAALAGLVLWNLTAYWPERWREISQLGGVTADLEREVVARRLTDALVFVWSDGLVYNEGFPLNDPFLERGPIFARDLGARNAELMALYPDRVAYRWTRQRELLPLAGAPAAAELARDAQATGSGR